MKSQMLKLCFSNPVQTALKTGKD